MNTDTETDTLPHGSFYADDGSKVDWKFVKDEFFDNNEEMWMWGEIEFMNGTLADLQDSEIPLVWTDEKKKELRIMNRSEQLTPVAYWREFEKGKDYDYDDYEELADRDLEKFNSYLEHGWLRPIFTVRSEDGTDTVYDTALPWIMYHIDKEYDLEGTLKERFREELEASEYDKK